MAFASSPALNRFALFLPLLLAGRANTAPDSILLGRNDVGQYGITRIAFGSCSQTTENQPMYVYVCWYERVDSYGFLGCGCMRVMEIISCTLRRNPIPTSIAVQWHDACR